MSKLKYIVFLQGNTSPFEEYGEDYSTVVKVFNTEQEAEEYIENYEFSWSGEYTMFYVKGKIKE